MTTMAAATTDTPVRRSVTVKTGVEHAFRVLGSGDFPVRVGPGPTRAPFRVRGPDDVARVLSAVVRLRTEAASTSRR